MSALNIILHLSQSQRECNLRYQTHFCGFIKHTDKLNVKLLSCSTIKTRLRQPSLGVGCGSIPRDNTCLKILILLLCQGFLGDHEDPQAFPRHVSALRNESQQHLDLAAFTKSVQ